MSDIIVIGGGHVGLTLLTDLVAAEETHGFRPKLLFVRDAGDRPRGPVTRTNLMDGQQDRVELREEHFGSLYGEEAEALLERAEHIIVTVPDIPVLRLELMRRIAGLRSLAGKVVTFVRAGQGGQPVVADWVRRTPRLRNTSIVLVEDSFYGTRISGRHIAYKRKLSVNVSVYSRTPHIAAERVRTLFPLGALIGRPSWPDVVVRPGIGLLFDPLGYIIHIGVAFHARNLAKTRAGRKYLHYTDGIDRELAPLLAALDEERVELAAAYGVETETFPHIIERQYGLPYRSDFYEMMQSCREIYRSTSCGSLDELRESRLIREDLPGLRTIRWLADAAGAALPVTKQYEADVTRTALELGVAAADLDGYLPQLSAMPEDVPFLRSLLVAPHELQESSVDGRSAAALLRLPWSCMPGPVAHEEVLQKRLEVLNVG
ncbi:NAD/NADP octopine/nopaline dehydrogenase family protein [Streptomyces malaysiensis]|uniref:NAD/NADP octopine/nopaline dehydrogenase family protein n=1 Tax=Streptomyces malaysiensis subsp. samsunensis TaxID=459658 RepID=A0A9X2M4G6_STRMQ|nr:NAD/NADP octopine/nopaline dehydrogenase family protein [Streptomyces samsunensis]MCQ8834848.1 NAD/NADP octopine/nopaline dehydrogenase family protein [Streptomyces samsunensis]